VYERGKQNVRRWGGEGKERLQKSQDGKQDA